MIFNQQLRLAVFTAVISLTTAVGNLEAQQLKTELPAGAQGIDVENKVGERIPLDAIFTDERGNKIGLGKFFNKKKAIVLTLNYSDCPGLCIAQLDNLVETLRKSNAAGLGDEFEIVTISIDPQEDHFKASNTKAKYTGLLKGTKAREAWHFLVGKQSEITKVAAAVGFKYTYDSTNKRYNHPAAIFFISPDGQICRYLLSLGVEPQQFKLAVADAGSGTLDFSIADSILQFCYLYDPNANRYTASARRMLAFAAGAFSLLLVGTTAPFWFRGKKAADEAGAAGNQSESQGKEIQTT
ncbi:MAG: SCO family protein [Aureliella sp.]